METLDTPLIEWSLASAALAGQEPSGDAALVQPFADGVLVAVVDGLGHGPLAAEAARAALGILERNAGENPVALVRLCHLGLRSTRGVVMSLASFDARSGTMSWLGVGNVEGVLLRAGEGPPPRRASLVLRGGLVGRRLPALVVDRIAVDPGDTLVFTTDGIASGHARGLSPADSPKPMAERILAEGAAHRDDALVLVAAWRGTERASG